MLSLIINLLQFFCSQLSFSEEQLPFFKFLFLGLNSVLLILKLSTCIQLLLVIIACFLKFFNFLCEPFHLFCLLFGAGWAGQRGFPQFFLDFPFNFEFYSNYFLFNVEDVLFKALIFIAQFINFTFILNYFWCKAIYLLLQRFTVKTFCWYFLLFQ